MPKSYILAGALILAVVLLVRLDRSSYVRELEAREIGVDLIKLPDDDPSRKNALLAAELINGVIIGPGETFSFNNLVGPRTVDRGFAEGLSILRDNGQLKYVRDLGGGICRTSTSLHRAVVSSGLEVKERHDHLIPVEYAERGQDAALLYGKQDYRFKNNRENILRLAASVQDGHLRLAVEEKVQVKVKKHNLINVGALYYYRERLKTVCRSMFESAKQIAR